MPDESKKVTMTFSGYDDSADSTVMFEGPLKINKVLDDISGLTTYDLSGFSSGDSVIAFVRNVNYNGTTPSKGSITYRGAFFKYDWTTLGWQQIMLGTHSHANMALLDELGNISTEGMSAGDEKILKIKKSDSTESGTAADYSIGFSDETILPEPPEDSEGKTLYLMRGSDGKLQWANHLVPSQTFCVMNVRVSSTIRPSGDSSKKSIFLSSSALKTANASYDKDSGDELLTFDGGNLIATATTVTDSGITITIADSETGHTFDDDETVTVIILRNGINGLLSSINRNFATKADLVSLSSKGTVDLSAYETKSDFKEQKSKFSIKGHVHPEYLRKDDYDAFDWRYADYNHTHAQYTTRNDVLAILADAVGSSGVISTDTAWASITASFEEKMAQYENKFITKETAEALIESRVSQTANTDSIIESDTGENLSDYLTNLQGAVETASNSTTDKVTSKAIKVNLGEGQTIGGYSNGDTINNGTTLTSVLTKLVTKEAVPELKNPELNSVVSQDTTASGKRASIKIAFGFSKGDGGDLSSLRLRMYLKKSPTDADTPYLDLSPDVTETSYDQKLDLFPIDDSGLCCTVVIDATYLDGPLIESNIAGKEYQIKAGKLSKTLEIYCERKYIFGYLKTGVESESDLTGDAISQAIADATMNEYDDDDIAKLGSIIAFQNESGARTLIFAEPESKSTKITKILYKEQGYDAMDLFSKIEHLQIKDYSGSVSGLSPMYRVYYLPLRQAIKSDMTFKLIF